MSRSFGKVAVEEGLLIYDDVISRQAPITSDAQASNGNFYVDVELAGKIYTLANAKRSHHVPAPIFTVLLLGLKSTGWQGGASLFDPTGRAMKPLEGRHELSDEDALSLAHGLAQLSMGSKMEPSEVALLQDFANFCREGAFYIDAPLAPGKSENLASGKTADHVVRTPVDPERIQEMAVMVRNLASLCRSMVEMKHGEDIITRFDNSTVYLGFSCGLASAFCSETKLALAETDALFLRLFTLSYSGDQTAAKRTFDSLTTLLKEERFLYAIAAGKTAWQKWAESNGAPIGAAKMLAEALETDHPSA